MLRRAELGHARVAPPIRSRGRGFVQISQMKNDSLTKLKKPNPYLSWLFPGICFIGASILFVTLLNSRLQIQHILDEGIHSTGTVIEKQIQIFARIPDVHWIVYRYTVEGASHVGRGQVSTMQFNSTCVGDPIDIVYVVTIDDSFKSTTATDKPTSIFGVTMLPLIIVSLGLLDLRRTQLKRNAREKPRFQVQLPKYVPDDFKLNYIEFYKSKKIYIANIVYDQKKSDLLIWLKEAQHPIPDLAPSKNATKNSTLINGIEIFIAKSSKKEDQIFIETDWSAGGLYFNLRTLGLAYDQVEMIVASLTL
jgi:hypothetical protein